MDNKNNSYFFNYVQKFAIILLHANDLFAENMNDNLHFAWK